MRAQSAKRVGPVMNWPEGARPSLSRTAPKYFASGSGMTFRNGENCWALVSDRSRRICFWYRHVKAIEGDRDEAIEPNQIN